MVETGAVAAEDKKDKIRQQLDKLVTKGSRIVLSSDLWRFAAAVQRADVLISFSRRDDNDAYLAELVCWLVRRLQQHFPDINIQVRAHVLSGGYGVHLTASFASLLRGAELVQLKKPVKAVFGGGVRDFEFEQAECFANVEKKDAFLSSQERAAILLALLHTMRAQAGGERLPADIVVPDGRAILPTLLAAGHVQQMQPVHESAVLATLRADWVASALQPQPLEAVRDYFGMQIGLYFAWLGHYAAALCVPAVVGVVWYFLGALDSGGGGGRAQLIYDVAFVLFALFNCVWSTLYLESWKRRQAELAYRWGTLGMERDVIEEPRPDFKGDSMVRSPVTGRMEPYYPVWKHRFTVFCVTLPVTALCVFALFYSMLWILRVQDVFRHTFGKSKFLWWLPYLPTVMYALIVMLGDSTYKRIALFLNDLENYRTQVQHENGLVYKIAFFQCVSAFGALFYIAFLLQDMRRLQETLATLLLTRQVVQNLLESLVPYFGEKLRLSRKMYRLTKSMSEETLKKHVESLRQRHSAQLTDGDDGGVCNEEGESTAPSTAEEEGLRQRRRSRFVGAVAADLERSRAGRRLPIPEYVAADELEMSQAELESMLPMYAGPLDDYLEMFIQFGYVLLFSPAFPLAAVCALANNLLEIRVDAFKLTNVVQRPFGRRVPDIGSWQTAMKLMGVAGVMVNCALIGQSGLVHRLWPDISWGGQILIIVTLEHVLLAFKYALDLAIPDMPHWVSQEMAKVENRRRDAFKRESRLLRRANDEAPHKAKMRSKTPQPVQQQFARSPDDAPHAPTTLLSV